MGRGASRRGAVAAGRAQFRRLRSPPRDFYARQSVDARPWVIAPPPKLISPVVERGREEKLVRVAVVCTPLPAASAPRENPSLGDFSAPSNQRQATIVNRSMSKFRDVHSPRETFVFPFSCPFSSFDRRLDDLTTVYCKRFSSVYRNWDSAVCLALSLGVSRRRLDYFFPGWFYPVDAG